MGSSSLIASVALLLVLLPITAYGDFGNSLSLLSIADRSFNQTSFLN